MTVIAAGGAPDGSFGTDSTKICKAVEDADNGKDGVVIITDVGSSIISAGLAIEGLAMDLHRRVRIADAPIVEGAIAAASEAGKGSTVDEVLRAAEQAKNISKKLKCLNNYTLTKGGILSVGSIPPFSLILFQNSK